MYAVICPDCQLDLDVPPELVGGEVECPKCGRQFASPAPLFQDVTPDLTRESRRRYARDQIRPVALAVLVYTLIRTVIDSFTTMGFCYEVFQTGQTNGRWFGVFHWFGNSAWNVLIFAAITIKDWLTLYAAWMMFNARGLGWFQLTAFLIFIPGFDYCCYLLLLPFLLSIWVIVCSVQRDVDWLLRSNNRGYNQGDCDD